MKRSISTALRMTVLLLLAGWTGSARAAVTPYQLIIGDRAINKLDAFNGSTGAAQGTYDPTNLAGLLSPQELQFRDGTIYVASQDTNQIKRYNFRSGAFIDNFVTAAGTTPTGIAFDAAGNLYVSNFSTKDVQKYSPTGTSLGTFVPAQDAFLAWAAFDSQGNYYVNKGQTVVQQWSSSGSLLNGSFFATANAAYVELGPDGRIYLAVTNGAGSSIIVRGAADGSQTTVTLNGTPSAFLGIQSLTFDPDGKMYVLDVSGLSNIARVLRYQQSGANTWDFVDTFVAQHGAFRGIDLTFTIPEPASMGLLGVGATTLLRRRR